MGSRGNIVIKEEGRTPIYFYTHWEGYRVKEILRDALVLGRSRWGDEPYLARIIFCEMVRDQKDELTGFGISTYEGDNDAENPIVYVDVSNNKVTVNHLTQTFEEFIKSMEGIPK